MTDDMLAELRAQFPDEIEAVSLSESVGSGKTTDGKLYANVSLTGVNPQYADANRITLQQGRFVNQQDMDGSKKVAVVSDKLASSMFGSESPLGKQITVTAGGRTTAFTVVGVYTYESGGMAGALVSDEDISTAAYIPISTAQKITGTSGYQSVTLQTAVGTDATTFSEEVKTFFNRYYSRNPDYTINAFTMESMLDSVTQMIGTLKIAISAIAAISLLVGGIGVMNIMLVSITERTKEIGTRKAIGAANAEILLQFIVEAVIICLIGGIIGILLGIVMGSVGASILGYPVRASVPTILITTGFSMAIGVFFGYYPARKAARMDPIEALRYE
jgi:putative ABC transport system permease protein